MADGDFSEEELLAAFAEEEDGGIIESVTSFFTGGGEEAPSEEFSEEALLSAFGQEGGEEESINDGEYKDLGLIEAAIQGPKRGFEKGKERLSSATGALMDLGRDPSVLGQDIQQLGQVGQSIGGAAMDSLQRDDGSFLDTSARIAGPISMGLAGAGAGASVGSVVPIVGTAIGGAVGFGLGVMGFDALLQNMDLLAEGQEPKTGAEFVGGVGEVGAEALLDFGAGKVATKSIVGVGKGREAIKRGFRNKANKSEKVLDPTQSLRSTLTSGGAANKLGRDLDRASKHAGPAMVERGHIMRANGELPQPGQGQVFQTIEDIIHKPDASGKSLLRATGEKIEDTISSSSRTFSIKEADEMLSQARLGAEHQKTVDLPDSIRTKALRPFKAKAAKAAGYKETDLDLIEADRARLADVESEVIRLTRQTSGTPPPRASRPKSREAFDAKRSDLESLKRERLSLRGKVEKFDADIDQVALSPVDFWRATRDAADINWGKDFADDASKLFGRFRLNIQDAIKEGLSPDSATAYETLNEQFFGMKVIDRIAKVSKDPEFGKIAQSGGVVRKIKRGIGNLTRLDEPDHPVLQDFKAFDNAIDTGNPNIEAGLSQELSKLYRFLGGGGLPVFTNRAKSLDGFFTPETAALFTRSRMAMEEFLNSNPDVLNTEREANTGRIAEIAGAVAELEATIKEGLSLPPELQRQSLKQLASNPVTRSLLPLDSNSAGFLKGVDAIGGQPLSAGDADKYFSNLRTSKMNNFEKSKRRRFYNDNGIFMPEPMEDKAPKIDEAELDKQIQKNRAREEISKIRSSKDVVKNSRASGGFLTLGAVEDEEEGFDTVSFDRAYSFVRDLEGGYVNDPDDRGGPTNFGVTQKTYNSYLRRNGLEKRSVTDISEAEAEDIYREFWAESGADDLPWPLSLAVFDASIHSGAPRAKKQLQLALGVKRDGRIGPDTLAALESKNANSVVKDFLNIREQYLESLNDPKFIKGWRNRVKKLRREVGSGGSGTMVA